MKVGGIKLKNTEIKVLEKIAKRSKMDTWFAVNQSNKVSESDINTLMDGVTPYDLETLTPEDMYFLINVLIHCNPIKSNVQ